MTATMTDETPRVWVSCLHCYNNGHLVGDWFEATEADTITIAGNVVVTQGRSVARGDRMTVKVKTGQVNLESSVKGRGKPGRVRGVFYPSETADAAPAAR